LEFIFFEDGSLQAKQTETAQKNKIPFLIKFISIII
jgi:hypothetical protein